MNEKTTTKKKKRTAPAQVSQNERMREASRGRKRKKRKSDLVAALLVVAVVLALATLVASFTLFYIEGVEVAENNGRYDDRQVIDAAGISDISHMLAFKAEDAAAAIERTLPYIETARVRRRLPGRIVVSVTYADPAFTAPFGESWLLLSVTGKVLELRHEKPVGVAYLSGLTVTEYAVGTRAGFAEDAAFEGAARLYAACLENGIDDVTEIDADVAGSVSFVVSDRFYIKGGTATATIEKLRLIALEIEERAGKTTAYSIVVLNDGSLSIRNRAKEQSSSKNAYNAYETYADTEPVEPKTPDADAEGDPAQEEDAG